MSVEGSGDTVVLSERELNHFRFLVYDTQTSGCYVYGRRGDDKLSQLDPRVITDVVNATLLRAMQKLVDQVTSGGKSYGELVLHKHAIQLRDKVTCLHLLWNGTVFKNMIIYMDLLPAFVLPPDVVLPRTLPLIRGQDDDLTLPYHVIAKKSCF